MSTEETPVPGLDDEREQLPPMPPGWMPVSEAGAAAIHSYIDTHWLPIIMDLTALDTAGALGGIRAIITERLRQVRDGAPVERDRYLTHGELVAYAHRRMHLGKIRQAAALLAAEIDRQAGAGS